MRTLVVIVLLLLTGTQIAHATCTASELLLLQRRGYSAAEIDEACQTTGRRSEADRTAIIGDHELDGIWQVNYRQVSCSVLPPYDGDEVHCPGEETASWQDRYGAPEFWKVSVTRSDMFVVVADRARRACRGGTEFAEYERLRIRDEDVRFQAEGRQNNLRWEIEFRLESDGRFETLAGQVTRHQIVRDPDTRSAHRVRRIEDVVLTRWPGSCRG